MLEHLAGMERISSRRMFGGIGLYRGARLFGIVFRGGLYLRADEGMRRALARAGGGGPFQPYRGRIITTFWQLGSAVITDKRRMRAWARRAIAASEVGARRTPGLARPPRRLAPPKKILFAPRRPRR